MVQILVSGGTRFDLDGNTIYCKALKTGYYAGGAPTMGGADSFGSVNAGSTLTLSPELHMGLTVALNSATSTVTLPSATGSGNYYNILSTINSTGQVIQTNGTDTLAGTITVAGGTGTGTAALPATGTNKTITMNGTTTGGKVGTYFTFIDFAPNLWFVEGNLVASGVAATPLS